jgi:hypothetical protein
MMFRNPNLPEGVNRRAALCCAIRQWPKWQLRSTRHIGPKKMYAPTSQCLEACTSSSPCRKALSQTNRLATMRKVATTPTVTPGPIVREERHSRGQNNGHQDEVAQKVAREVTPRRPACRRAPPIPSAPGVLFFESTCVNVQQPPPHTYPSPRRHHSRVCSRRATPLWSGG